MDNVFNILTVILFGGLSLLAFFAALRLLLPKPIQQTQQVLENSGGRSLLLGLVNFIFFGLVAVLGVWLSERTGSILAGIFVLLSGVITLAVTFLTLIGLVALANMLGTRIKKDAAPFETILRGGALLILAGLAPYVGWFLFTPLASWTGLGAAITALVRKREGATSSEKKA
jgi:glucan phosphoethanolaminetransferase (alkaline phosphatase superfamily)